ncbi:hypothetical protein GGD66_000624 [Bradyrhizobium sp. CIR48]|nr:MULTISPECIES: hypothetical protein [unclassified Bradyrhizobium]MBB4359225.1 hypothetical protein [Bradyrhizobium sp. CIR18]MBB4378262.1 hypothetical protein [Bradyrhizobium sp. SBR1B]MBB4422098.1 hypothetical protein [Bradyrhizobium sp. CIR48]SFN15076.1 hypothetical protein SAMN05216573_108384 [Bradyrhizobium sp. Rc3b]MBB4391441.1 hypothetical protein [Bradyrhizobium sp. ERR14]
MLSLIESLVCRLASASARPQWTLLAISNLLSAAIVLIVRSAV